jgi:hypothetical protein
MVNGMAHIDNHAALGRSILSELGGCFSCGVIFPWHPSTLCAGRGNPAPERERKRRPLPKRANTPARGNTPITRGGTPARGSTPGPYDGDA